jgi:hypothetical protein
MPADQTRLLPGIHLPETAGVPRLLEAGYTLRNQPDSDIHMEWARWERAIRQAARRSPISSTAPFFYKTAMRYNRRLDRDKGRHRLREALKLSPFVAGEDYDSVAKSPRGSLVFVPLLSPGQRPSCGVRTSLFWRRPWAPSPLRERAAGGASTTQGARADFVPRLTALKADCLGREASGAACNGGSQPAWAARHRRSPARWPSPVWSHTERAVWHSIERSII